MKRLLVLWDPENPIVPVAPVVRALRDRVELLELTFQDVSHRTSPIGTFGLRPFVEKERVDALLWIEGGPLPGDLEEFLSCAKACWLVNSHHEPTLLEEIGPRFDHRLVASLDQASDERSRWVPLAAHGERVPLPEGGGVWLSGDDPKPPITGRIEQVLRSVNGSLRQPNRPIVLCPGQGGEVNRTFFDCLNSGAVVVVDRESDLRGLAHASEHLEVLPSSVEETPAFLNALAGEPERLARLGERGPEIVEHLHTPALRATQIVDAIWPQAEILAGGASHSAPEVSVLAVCYRYLRRFKHCLESLAKQDLAVGVAEIVVVDPESPDGLAGYLAEFAARHPHLRVVRVPLDPRYHRNRGIAINRAFDASRGDVIVSIDGDIVFPRHLLRAIRDHVRAKPQHVYGVRRMFVGRDDTGKILTGEIDPLRSFEALSASEGDGEEKGFVGVLGYCQAVERRAFARARYPEEFDCVNQSDIVFVERLRKYAQVEPHFLEDERVLHLWHPRNWSGTHDWL